MPKPSRKHRKRLNSSKVLWCARLAKRLCTITDGCPLREIARRTGYNHETIRRYLLRGHVPARFVAVVAAEFNTPPGWLLTGPQERDRR